ncbi:MAG: TRAP transporter small permease subunit [Desulfovermiculus sp.]|nr:TRAP transporter small permease subunit [Desulfovermiculus sp.]
MPKTQTTSHNAYPGRTWMLRSVKVFDWITDWQGRIFAWTILIGTLQICYELVMRYFFNSPSTWGLEMTTYLCAVTYVMSGAFAEYHNAHIRVDIFYSNWSTRTRAFVDVFLTDLLLLMVCSIIVWQGWLWFWKAWSMGLTSGTIWDPPIWPMRLALVMGAFFFLLAGLSRMVQDAYTLFTGHKLNPKAH